jgi:hypothetical protein
MKRTIIACSLAFAAVTANAAGITAGVTTITANTAYQVCDGTVAGAGKTAVMGGPGAVVASPAAFTRTGFNIQCSNNVSMSILENDNTKATVGAVSLKGNQRFGGNSNGGAVNATAKCSADPCPTGDVTTALSEASSI